MRCGIIRVIAQGQTKDKTSIGPGLLIPINKDARITLLCSDKSRRAPSTVLGETPRADGLVGLLREKLTSGLGRIFHTRVKLGTVAIIHVAAL
jgi:hypothetical protein